MTPPGTDLPAPPVLALEGEIDMTNYLVWRDRGDRALDRARTPNLTVDFRAVDFIDSCGLAMLAWLYNRVTPLGGDVAITNVPHHIERLIEVAGMDAMFAAPAA